jgi:two-component system, NtrC family, sensor kinase
MATPLRVLMLEDRPADAELILHALRRAGFSPEWQRVETELEYRAHLRADLDVILADYALPQFDALRALQQLQERGLDIPFVIVSGTIGEEVAVAAMKQGAADYLLKDRLTRLGQVVAQALEQKQLREAKRQAEEKYRAIFDNAVEGIFQMTPDGRFITANPALARMLGYASPEEPITNLTNIEQQLRFDAAHRAEFQRLLVEHGFVQGFETRLTRPDGSAIWIALNVRTVYDASGTLLYYEGTTEAITARKQAEEALQAKNEELQTISQQLWQTAKLATMGELAASIAHELNNPLATVSLRVESLLAQAAEDDPRRRSLLIIEQEVERMGTLVANLLQFSRRSQPQISSVDVREELENTLALMQYHLRNHRITVVRQFALHVPLVHADRQQLQQVFLNLLTNASDAMPQGGTLTLGVELGWLESGAPAVVITFTDTGTGIAPEHMTQVMEPFFTTKPEGKGTGLGLAICRRIMQEHHGTIALSSSVDEGTTVRLLLPSANGSNAAYVRASMV